MNYESQVAYALDLLDFCGGDLTISQANKFFAVRALNLDDEQRKKIFLTAYTLTDSYAKETKNTRG